MPFAGRVDHTTQRIWPSTEACHYPSKTGAGADMLHCDMHSDAVGLGREPAVWDDL